MKMSDDGGNFATSDSRGGRFAVLAEMTRDAIVVECDGVIVHANQMSARILGAGTAADLVGLNSLDIVHPDHHADAMRRRERTLSDGRPSSFLPARHLRRDGTDFVSEVNVARLDWNGRTGTIVVIRDVTARREAEEALRESEERFRDMADASSSWLWETGPDLCVEWLSHSAREILGDEIGKILGRGLRQLGARIGDPERHWRHLEDIANQRPFRDFAVAIFGPDGGERHLRLAGKPLFDRDWRFMGYRGVGQDVTAAVRAERMREDFVDAIEHVPESFALFDTDDRFVACNGEFRAFSGLPPKDLVPGLPFEVMLRRRLELGIVDIDHLGVDAEEWIASRMETHRDPGSPIKVRVGDRWRQVREARLPNGGTVLTSIDITEAVRREDQRRQSRTMESIAHLTAGIAHDFNNLLSVVLGNLELAQEFDIADPNLRDMLARASEAADRGGVLTQRLLAFSRRQMLTPNEIAPRDLIEGMSGNLRRILGDAIQIHVELQDDIWPCRADPKQLAITLSSLAANSRDAMPDGGRLTIEGRNISVGDEGHAIPGDVTPGEYVAFTVSDTGTGMPPDVVERAFEPFFTTKDIGADAGLGLGLSVVFGFITQSGGHATIRSGEGDGTSVRFILPRFIDSVAAEAPAAKVSPRLEAKTGNVVVVEDDTDVRELLVSQMNSLGYAVYGVATAAEAMDIIDARPEIDLLLSDVLLAGGTSGPRLAKEATNRRPDMAVLFMSGYVELKNVGLDADDALLHKPFSMAELAGKVRRALASRP